MRDELKRLFPFCAFIQAMLLAITEAKIIVAKKKGLSGRYRHLGQGIDTFILGLKSSDPTTNLRTSNLFMGKNALALILSMHNFLITA